MPHGWKARRTISALTAVVAVTAGFGAVGEPLQPEACDTLKAELARLEGLGVGNDLRRGPEVGKRTLAPARLAQVERLLAVIEQIEFRCPKPPPPPPAEAKSGAPAGADGAGPAKAKPKPKPATHAADPATPAENSAAKPPPKRKATDAFVPPASDAPVTKSAPSQAPSQAVTKSPSAAAPAAKPGLEQ